MFQESAPEEFDYSFERTIARVRITESECISRSAAKRLVAPVDEFKDVVLDFAGVSAPGQAFADEVFRVFMQANRGMKLKVRDLKSELPPMVRHIMDSKIAERVEIVANVK